MEIDVNMDDRRSSVRTGPVHFHYCCDSVLSPVHSFLSLSLPILTEGVKAVLQIGAADAQIREHCSAAAKLWFVAVVYLAFPQQRLGLVFFSPIKKMPSRQVGHFSLSHLSCDG